MSALVNEILTTKKILEDCLETSKRGDPKDALFPLVGHDAEIWHRARAEAFRHALEMLPDVDAMPVPDELLKHAAGAEIPMVHIHSNDKYLQEAGIRPQTMAGCVLYIPGMLNSETKKALEDFIQNYRVQIGGEYDRQIDVQAAQIAALEDARDHSSERFDAIRKELDDVVAERNAANDQANSYRRVLDVTIRERDDALAAVRALRRMEH